MPPSAFEPPVGAVSKPGCINPSQGSLVKAVNPLYPDFDRRSHTEGTVAVYGVITTDGVFRDLRIVSGLSPGLNKVSLDAVKQWRYEPARCNGVATEVETVVFVNFSLH
jgi:TonB family protein